MTGVNLDGIDPQKGCLREGFGDRFLDQRLAREVLSELPHTNSSHGMHFYLV